MSTRAIIGYRSEARRWKGVWNHWEGHPQYLGHELIARVATFDGELRRLVGQYVDRCPEGWSNFRQGFESSSVAVQPFGRVVFAADGVATPSELPTIEE